MRLKHGTVWVGLTAAALMATSACGADSAEKAAEVADKADSIMAALMRASDRTEEIGSAQVKMSTDMGNGKPIAMEGTYSWGDGYAFDVEMDTAAVQMQQLHAAPRTRTLFVDGAYYYDIDPQPSGPLQGKEWMKIDASAIFGDKGAQAFDGSGDSPSASMKGLRYANDVEDLGKEKVDGQSATHYKAVVDKDHMGKFKDAYGDQNNLLNSVAGGVDAITMDVWVNDKDLPVRMTQHFGRATVTIDFEKFGGSTKIQAPPAAETGDLTEQVKARQQG
ncbi:hypothetical protein JS756_29345 [Streptomyces actuosus]|uniref:Lipoprotein n=1 Tax=Streptomyces actuosus TaxID=1885 RepID=A0ABS2VYM4_STRAS|nr:hypothetical protein [Streptomyces actuosus]MBN0048143.1 hypothetical protein [Streptomyces actuosus]